MQDNQKSASNTNPFPQLEEEVLNFWEKSQTFQRSINKEAPKGDYVFYDGPPFATGEPHYGHIVGSIMKDAVPRYWTMNGFHVERKWGWDCHGLPIENIAEKELGITHKKDIEAMGVDKFNEFCRSKVLGYVDIWKKIITRAGRWADMESPYKTMDIEFMESVWWVFKQLWEKDLIYESYRSMHICPRCETTLSQSEVSEGYKDIKDLSATVKFKLVPGQILGDMTVNDNTYVLAWTTTPWTLIGNAALAVGDDINYYLIKTADDYLFVAKEKLEIIKEEYHVIQDFMGGDLIGIKYQPLFDYYAKDENLKNRENGWQIYAGDFVTTEDGTGVVHIAPAFGEDDMNLGKEYELPFIQHVGMDGIIKPEATDFAGMNVKPIDDHMKTDVEIIKYLAGKNSLYHKEKYKHSYPHCWRCETPLLNYATSSYFVKVTDLKDDLLESAKNINWSPNYLKEGRFGNWLEGARDWSISRQRFWASVMPVWKCDCGEIKVVGSVDEIKEQFGNPNKLFLIRHGLSENNIKNILSCSPEKENYSLTEKGKQQIITAAEKLKAEKIDLIISSPLQRTRESAEIIAKMLGIDKVIFDDRLREVDLGDYNGRNFNKWPEIQSLRNDINEQKVETGGQIGERLNDFIMDLNNKYQNKNIAIVSHGDPLRAIDGVIKEEKANDFIHNNCLSNGEVKMIYSKKIDLHKHIVDKITFPCPKCGGLMKRIPDVLDTWFDSGSMPYAQMHYPFENKEKFEANFPAKFIAEGVDQTRCWFYYLHVLASAIRGHEAYENVIVNGIVLAEDGKKMSKRLKNYPDVNFIFNRYGADAMRFYLLSSHVMLAENLNFSENGVKDVLRNVCMTLWNVYKFYEMFATDQTSSHSNSTNILDQWIIARLNELIKEATENMNGYNLPKATRPIADFINDFSTWYLRRSRDRFKGDDEADKQNALATTKFIFTELAKVMAPFTPFIAEQIWQKVTGYNFTDENKSVHLEAWPSFAEASDGKPTIIEEMETVRKIVELGLAERDKAGIKVRQPLTALKFKILNLKFKIKLVDILAKIC